MKNKKIAFQKLVDHNCPYSLSEQIQILEWMFKTSEKYQISHDRWYKSGFDKLVYNYCHNDHATKTAIVSEFQIWFMFMNAIVPTTMIQKWREDYGVKLGLTKFLSFKLGNNEYLRFGDKTIFEILNQLQGAKLKKEHFHPDYPNDTNPFIKSIKFTISYQGCHILLDYTFDVPDCKYSSWTKEFWKRDESVEDFFLESFKTIDSWLVEPWILAEKTNH